MKIQTKIGMIERSELTVVDTVTEEDNARVTATEWTYKNELVRRDVNVNILRALSISGEQESI